MTISTSQLNFTASMQCHSPLTSESLHGQTINRCITCDGLWLDDSPVAWLLEPSERGLRGLLARLKEPRYDGRLGSQRSEALSERR